MVIEPTRHTTVIKVSLVIMTQDNLVSNITVGERHNASDHKLLRVDV